MILAHYVGIPWKLHGDDRDGIDCWGLVRLVYREEWGVDLPSFGDRYGRALSASERAHIAGLVRGEVDNWRPVEDLRRGDVALFRVMGDESHLGIVADASRFLHARPGTDSCVERFDAPGWSRRLAAIYRWHAWP